MAALDWSQCPAVESNPGTRSGAWSETESGLGLSSKDAASVVQYRQTHGDYKTVDNVKKVPGIDTTKIDAGRQLPEFQ